MKTLILLLALVTTTFAGLNDPVEFRGTVAGAIMEKLADGEILICATQIRSKTYKLEDLVAIVIVGVPANRKTYLEEMFKCTGVLTKETRQVHAGFRPYPVFKYVGN